MGRRFRPSRRHGQRPDCIEKDRSSCSPTGKGHLGTSSRRHSRIRNLPDIRHTATSFWSKAKGMATHHSVGRKILPRNQRAQSSWRPLAFLGRWTPSYTCWICTGKVSRNVCPEASFVGDLVLLYKWPRRSSFHLQQLSHWNHL